MFEPLEEQPQWQVEVELGRLIRQLQNAQLDAENAEHTAHQYREKEAELVVKVREYRQQLGLPDTPIGSLLESNGRRSTFGAPGEEGREALHQPSSGSPRGA